MQATALAAAEGIPSHMTNMESALTLERFNQDCEKMKKLWK